MGALCNFSFIHQFEYMLLTFSVNLMETYYDDLVQPTTTYIDSLRQPSTPHAHPLERLVFHYLNNSWQPGSFQFLKIN